MSSVERPANRLIHETSPYLRQHAHNPVDWHPWGPPALALARKLDKPIFLSIGYSACHWCHVMEHESFEDDDTARILNEHFVNIKVDREERPDLDQLYMQAVVALTRQGGWPMSVWLTPQLEPFYAGTYFPPRDMYGRPSFRKVCLALAEVWRSRRQDVARSAAEIADHLRQAAQLEPDDTPLDPELMKRLVRVWEQHCDRTHGGIGGAPKFPHALELRSLLRAADRFRDDSALAMARLTFDHMARGGLYDQLGGGFHRYSTDERWLVPHFEKMLYDNALLSRAYLEAYQATGDPQYRQVVEETLAWVEREMTGEQGEFFSTLDADSEGEEGKFYVWSAREVEEVLGPELYEPFAYVYDVSTSGNWEGRTILHLPKSVTDCARLLRVEEGELRKRLAEARSKLLAVRNRRVRPSRDEKVLTSWNGLMIAAFAEAAQTLGPRYAQPARRAAEFLLTHLRAADGRLFRTASAGGPAKLNAYLEDYAFLLDALVSLYEATFEARWIASAVELAGVLREQFWDADRGGFFFVAADHEPLPVRSKQPQDNAVPSGNSMAATGLLRLARLTGRNDLEEMALGVLKLTAGQMARMPTTYGQMLCAVDFWLGPAIEFALVGDQQSAETAEALRLLRSGFRPRKVVAFKSSLENGAEAERVVPLLAGKTAVDGRTTLYMCRGFACREPAVGREAIVRALG